MTVLAKQADSYYYIPTLWAAILGLLTPVVLSFTPLWLEVGALLLSQWLVFIVLALVFRAPAIKMLLVTRAVKQWQFIVDEFTRQVKAGNTQQGFIDCIEQCGELLKQHAFAGGEKNELPNHLVVL